MSPRYQFLSPGAAAGEGLIDILARQRAEQRQNMLDEITKQNAESQRAVSAEHILSSKQGRLLTDVQNTTPYMEAGDDPSTLNLDPDVLAYMRTHGQIRKGGVPVPQVTTSVSEAVPAQWEGDDSSENGPVAPPAPEAVAPPPNPQQSERFVGSEKDRERDRKIMATKVLVEKLHTPNLTDADKVGILTEMEANGVNLDSGTYNAIMKHGQKRFIYDPVTNKVTTATDEQGNAIPENSQLTIRSRPPREPAAPRAYDYVGTNDKGEPVTLDNRNGSFKVTSGFRIGAKPSVAGANAAAKEAAAWLPAPIANKLTDAFGIASKPDGPAKIQQAQQSAIAAFPRSVISDDVRDALNKALFAEDPSTTYQEILDANQDSFATPQEFEAFKRALAFLRGAM